MKAMLNTSKSGLTKVFNARRYMHVTGKWLGLYTGDNVRVRKACLLLSLFFWVPWPKLRSFAWPTWVFDFHFL